MQTDSLFHIIRAAAARPATTASTYYASMKDRKDPAMKKLGRIFRNTATTLSAIFLAAPAPSYATDFTFYYTTTYTEVWDEWLNISGTLTADFVSPGVYHVTNATGTFTSTDFGGGNIIGVNADESGLRFPRINSIFDNLSSYSLSGLNCGSQTLSLLTDNPLTSSIVVFPCNTPWGNAYAADGGTNEAFVNGSWGNFSATPVVGAPEIDGAKLPLAIMLLGLLFVIGKRRRRDTLSAS